MTTGVFQSTHLPLLLFGLCFLPSAPGWATPQDNSNGRGYGLYGGGGGTFHKRPASSAKSGLDVVHQWSQLEYDFASEADRDYAVRQGYFNPGKPTPTDVDVHYAKDGSGKRRIFLAMPRFQLGVPATYGVVTDKLRNENPIIQAYPSWEWHTNSKQCRPNRIVSAYRAMIDECDRLWIADTGIIGTERICPPQILAFDLNTDKPIVRYEIPSDQVKAGADSILITPVADVRRASPTDQCYDTFVYIADVTEYGLLVYDMRNNKSWRITSNLFYPYPPYGRFNINGESFDLMDGLFGMALSPYRGPGDDRTLFFHALASITENSVPTSVIRNHTLFESDPNAAADHFKLYPKTRQSQSAAMAIDRNGIAYFGLLSQTAMACWDTKTEYGQNNIEIVDENRDTLQFMAGVKVITNPADSQSQELWVLTPRFQKIMAGTMSLDEINFRVLMARTEDLTKGSRKCKAGAYGVGQRYGSSSSGGYGLFQPASADNHNKHQGQQQGTTSHAVLGNRNSDNTVWYPGAVVFPHRH